MKLYRIYRKEAFVTRLPLEEKRIELPAAGMIPAKISLMPGVPVEVCEMIAAHWAERRVTVPEKTEMVDSVIPEHTKMVEERTEGYFETRMDYIDGHYETQEMWIPEHEEEHFVEVPGHYEMRETVERPQAPGYPPGPGGPIRLPGWQWSDSMQEWIEAPLAKQRIQRERKRPAKPFVMPWDLRNSQFRCWKWLTRWNKWSRTFLTESEKARGLKCDSQPGITPGYLRPEDKEGWRWSTARRMWVEEPMPLEWVEVEVERSVRPSAPPRPMVPSAVLGWAWSSARKKWLETPMPLEQVWVEPTREYQTVTVPGQFRDHRVWIEGHIGEVEVWVPAKIVLKEVTVAEMVISTPVVIPERVVREKYWKDEYKKCWMMHPEQMVIAGVPVPADQAAALGEWFAWYQTTPAGQMFMDGAKSYGWLEDWSSQQVLHKAWDLYRRFQPDVTVRIAPDVFMKMKPHELDNMLKTAEGLQYLRSKGLYEWASKLQREMTQQGRTRLSDGEIAVLVKAGAIAAMVAAAGLLVYHTWPGAKFELTINYPKPVYVGRYMEVVTELDLVGVSPKGNPFFYRCKETGGPIMGEERSVGRDKWLFGEDWLWSSWSEEARWMGMGETRYWTEAEVEYLGMLSRSGAAFYILNQGRMEAARGGNEPGWTKPSTLWGTWEELEHHIRI